MAERIVYSEEKLNEFVDGELTPEEDDEIIQAMNHDPELYQRVNDIKQIRSMYQMAFDNSDKENKENKENSIKPRLPLGLKKALAASLLLSLGGLFGWFTGNAAGPVNPIASYPPPYLTLSDLKSEATSSELRAIVRFSNEDVKELSAKLDQIESLLKDYRSRNKPAQIDVVVHAKAFSILQPDKSPLESRILELQQKYKELQFVACGNTYKRLGLDKKGKEALLPNVYVASSAIEHIIHRVKDRWSYLEI